MFNAYHWTYVVLNMEWYFIKPVKLCLLSNKLKGVKDVSAVWSMNSCSKIVIRHFK
jgi:hypothetical protein